jgi:hypothetical protein
LAVELMARDLFRSYAVMAVPNSLQSQQGAATSGDESLVAFHGYVAQAGLDIDGAEFERDKPEIESLLRAAIEERSNAGRTKCGIRLGADPQLAKALTVFREAKMVSGLH